MSDGRGGKQHVSLCLLLIAIGAAWRVHRLLNEYPDRSWSPDIMSKTAETSPIL